MSIEMIFKLTGLVVLSSLPFLFTLNGNFVFDDSEALLKNNDIKSESWTDCFYNDFWGTNIKSAVSHKSYRPLTVLSFRLNYIWNNGQLTVFPFKVTNLLCHIVCCLLVWRTFKKILNTCSSTSLNAIDISYFATLLFAVHPIHVEAVSGIVGRADLLCAITFFIAFLLYNKAMTNDKFSFVTLLLSVSMAAISMLFKENGVTVLGFCLFYEVINALDKSKEDLKNPRNISRMGILCVSIVLLLYARWTVMGGTKPKFSHLDNPAAFSDSLFRKIATYNYIYFINFLILIWPQWLCCDWSMGCIPLIKKVTDVRLLFILLLYAYAIALLVAIFEIKNKVFSRPLLLSAALMVIPFIPAANIFYPVGFVIAERILYIPSAGYCLIIVIGLNKIILSRNQYKMGVFCYGILLLSMGLRSWQRSYDWQNEYQLFTSGVTVCPRNAKIHYNVAKVADANNETKFAMQSYRQALRLNPEYHQAMNNLANLLKNQKKYYEAEYYLRKALKLERDFPAAWMNLGVVLASTKRLDEAESAYKTALQYRKKYPDCFYNLGNLYLEMNRTNEAMENWLQAVHLKPKHVLAWTNLIALLDNTEQMNKALQVIPDALKELPDAPSINFAVGNIYGKLGRFAEAERHFLRAIELSGTNVPAIYYANLGVLYHRWKKIDLAENMYNNALKINNTFKSAITNLNSLKKLKQQN